MLKIGELYKLKRNYMGCKRTYSSFNKPVPDEDFVLLENGSIILILNHYFDNENDIFYQILYQNNILYARFPNWFKFLQNLNQIK